MSLAIQCGGCGAKFKMPERLWEQRVAGKVATLHCRKCRAPIQLDGTATRPKTASGSRAPAPKPPAHKAAQHALSSGAVAHSPVAPHALGPEHAPPRRRAHQVHTAKAIPDSVPVAKPSSGARAPARNPAPPARPARPARPTPKPASSAVPIVKSSAVPRPSAKATPAADPAPAVAPVVQAPPAPVLDSATRSRVVSNAATLHAELDSVPSLRALSLPDGAPDALLDDGPTPPPVTRSGHTSERARSVEAKGSSRSSFGRATVSGVVIAAGALLGGALLWKTPASVGELQLTRHESSGETRVPLESSEKQAAHEAAPQPAPQAPPVQSAVASDSTLASPPASPAETGGTPDEQRLGFAVSWARSHALACHQGGRAVGDVTLTITFAPSGRVSDVAMRGEPVASAPVGRCVADYYRAMLVPAFEGEPFTVSEQLSLR